jgi:hypothetical protein
VTVSGNVIVLEDPRNASLRVYNLQFCQKTRS